MSKNSKVGHVLYICVSKQHVAFSTLFNVDNYEQALAVRLSFWDALLSDKETIDIQRWAP